MKKLVIAAVIMTVPLLAYCAEEEEPPRFVLESYEVVALTESGSVAPGWAEGVFRLDTANGTVWRYTATAQRKETKNDTYRIDYDHDFKKVTIEHRPDARGREPGRYKFVYVPTGVQKIDDKGGHVDWESADSLFLLDSDTGQVWIYTAKIEVKNRKAILRDSFIPIGAGTTHKPVSAHSTEKQMPLRTAGIPAWAVVCSALVLSAGPLLRRTRRRG